MPVDAEAAGKTQNESKKSPLDLGNISDTPGQRMKELVNLDSFKNSISNICQLWLGGLPAPPRRYEQWRSKIVQQEKISFVDQALTQSPSTDPSRSTITAASAPPLTSLTMQSSSHSSSNGANGSILTSTQHVTFKRNKRKEPYELLEEMYKHTYDPLPE